MAREKLPPPLLKNMIHDILSELSKDEFYPTEMQWHLKIVPKSKYHIFMSYTKGALNV